MILLVTLITVTAGARNGTEEAPASRFDTLHKEVFVPSFSTSNALSSSAFEPAGPVCDPDRPCVPPFFGWQHLRLNALDLTLKT
jgi:hypothetical protein